MSNRCAFLRHRLSFPTWRGVSDYALVHQKRENPGTNSNMSKKILENRAAQSRFSVGAVRNLSDPKREAEIDESFLYYATPIMNWLPRK
jgi:hypothetical protein